MVVVKSLHNLFLFLFLSMAFFFGNVAFVFAQDNFAEGNIAQDNVAENIHTQGTASGSPEFISTKVSSRSLQVNGVSDVIRVAHSDSLAVGVGDFAVSFWFRLEQGFTGQWRSVLHKGETNSQRTFAMWMRPNDNRFHFRISTDNNWNEGGNSVQAIPVGRWTHITYVKQGDQLKLYLNGRLDNTHVLDGSVLANTGDIYIGSSPWSDPAFATYAEINVYRRMVSSLEAKSLYEAKFNGFDIEEQAVLQGSPEWVALPTTNGNGLRINSDEDTGVVSHSILLPTDSRSFTIAFWFRLEQGFTGQRRSILHKGAADDQRTFAMWMRPDDNRLRFSISTESHWDEGDDSTRSIPLDQWTHITYVKKGNELRLYINGELDKTVFLNGEILPNDGPLYIGASPWHNPAYATYDRINAFKRGLLPEAVSRLYGGALTRPHIEGEWGDLIPWPHIAVSAANLPDGRILTWSGSERTFWPEDEQTYSATWNPEDNQFLDVFHEGHNMFCAHLAMTEDGQVFVNGGRNQSNSPWVSVFDYRNNEWAQIENMTTGGRWYPVTMALPSGELMTSMGTATNFANPEKWSANTGWQVLNGIDYSQMRTTNDGTSGGNRWWANLSVAPSGDVFHFWSSQESHFISTQGIGTYRDANAVTNDADVAPGVNIQYDAGKMLITGGNQGSWGNETTYDQAFTVDLNGPTPVIETAERMIFPRAFHNLIPMPDGKVLAVGGNTSALTFSDVGTVYEAEIWDPLTREWTSTAPMAAPRNYHSIGLLLKDGRVLSAGGGYCSNNDFCNGASHQNGQVYSPPYLFNPDGTLAERPAISSGPGVIRSGEVFTLIGSDDITSFSLIKMSSTTHAVNTDARFSWVDFQKINTNEFELTPNSNSNVLIPGYWMLFALNEEGVPSVAHIVRVEKTVSVTTPGPNRYIRFEANSEVNGNPWSSVAELTILDGNGDPIDRSSWKITADSEEPDGLARYAIDGDPSTIWHTSWREFAGSANDPKHPHELVIDLRGGYVISGLTYLPRQNVPNGRVADYTIYVSSDGNEWRTIDQGVFPDSNVSNGNALHVLNFTANAQQVVVEQAEPSAINAQSTFTASHIEGLEYNWSFGDGTPVTGFQAGSTVNHTYTSPGRYIVVLTIRDPITGEERTLTSTKIVHDSRVNPETSDRWLSSSSIHFHPAKNQVWNVNPDNNTVTVIDTVSFLKLAEITVGDRPSALAFAVNGNVWVTNKHTDSISILDADELRVVDTIQLPNAATKPHGIVIEDEHAYVVLENTSQLLKISTISQQIVALADTVNRPRHIAKSTDGSQLFVNAFIVPLVAGEGSDTPDASDGIDGISLLSSADLSLQKTIRMQHSNADVTENSGPGIANYLGAMALHPAGDDGYIPSKQDNILSGRIRNGVDLSFDQAVRAVSSRIDLIDNQETVADRIDHDNASVASAAVYGPYGIHLFTALEGNRQVAVSNTTTDSEILRFNVGLAPQGLALSGNGQVLAVHNFMARSVELFDIRNIVDAGGNDLTRLARIDTVSNEQLTAPVLKGKQLFYDSADDRLAALDYMSCAACHNEGDHDGRVWDFTQFGEGLRNTTSLRGKAGVGQGLLHWTGNFDEVQDFEGQIRGFAGGTGLMDTADFLTGTRSEPLGDPKAGLSADLDDLAAYLESLSEPDLSPFYSSEGLSDQAQVGAQLFQEKGCVSCHASTMFTDSNQGFRHDVGTLTTASGERLSGFLDGLDTPTLLGLWSSGPYLHDGSATSVEQAITSHIGVSFDINELQSIVRYLYELPHQQQLLQNSQVIQFGRIQNAQADNDTWYTVTFEQVFDTAPIVVAGPASFAGGQPLTIRVRNISTTGFEIQMDEWDYLDGSHIKETIDYVAILPGNHVVGGLKLEALSVPVTEQWQDVVFAQGFTQSPVVLTQISSYNDTQAATTRVNLIDVNKVQVKIDEEERNDRIHHAEQVHIIAIEPGAGIINNKKILVGRTSDVVSHNWKSVAFPESIQAPLLIAHMQTTHGDDTATVRYRTLTSTTIEFHIDEEQSADVEVGHVNEAIGWLLLEQ